MKIENYKIFNIVINEENGETKVVLGNNLIDTLPNEKKAKSKIDKKPWEYILKVIIIVVNNILKMEEKKDGKN